MKKACMLFFSLLFANYFCKTDIDNSQLSDSIYLKFKIDDDKILNFRDSDEFLNVTFIDNMKDGSTIKISANDNLKQVLVFESIQNSTSFFAKENDSILITFSNGNFELDYLNKIRGRNKNNLNLYNDYNSYLKKDTSLKSIGKSKNQFIKDKNIEEIFNINQQLFEFRKEFLNDYKKQKAIEEDYATEFLHQFYFPKLKLNYWSANDFNDTSKTERAFHDIEEYFQNRNVNPEIIDDLFKIILDYGKLKVKPNENSEMYAKKLFHVIKNNFFGFDRDMLILRLLSKGKNPKILDEFYKDFETFAFDSAHLAKAKDIIQKNKDVELNENGGTEILLLNKDGQKFTFDELRKKHKNQNLYVDFWASWCAPCLQEIPKSLVGQQNFKKVKFIYISIDDNQEKWIKSNVKNLGEYADSYLVLNPDNSSLLKKISLQEIPRHIIINKKGEIEEENAPGINDLNFGSVLNKFESK